MIETRNFNSDKLTTALNIEEQAVILASAHFLSNRIPNDFFTKSKREQEDYIMSNKSGLIEQHSFETIKVFLFLLAEEFIAIRNGESLSKEEISFVS